MRVYVPPQSAEARQLQGLLEAAEARGREQEQRLAALAREQEQAAQRHAHELAQRATELAALQRQVDENKKNQEWMLQGIIQEKEKEISRLREEVHSYQERERLHWREREEREKDFEREKSQLESAYSAEMEATRRSHDEAMAVVEERVRKILAGKDKQIDLLRAKILEYEKELHGIAA